MVIVVMQGDYGKVRPAVVIQSDLLADIPSVIVLPCSTDLIADCIYRPDIPVTAATGLERATQAMADKIAVVSKRRVREVIGRVDDQTLATLAMATQFVTGMFDDQGEKPA
jgi:mRNA interferase MazF